MLLLRVHAFQSSICIRLINLFEAQFVYGAVNTRQCSDLPAITTEADCRTAAVSLTLTFGSAENVADYPRDCYKAPNNKVYWNTHPTGKNQAQSTPICKQAPRTHCKFTTQGLLCLNLNRQRFFPVRA